MSGVFRNIDPHPLTARRVCPPPAFGEERGWGVNSSEDARHCSVLYISKYFVLRTVHCLQPRKNCSKPHVKTDTYIEICIRTPLIERFIFTRTVCPDLNRYG
jgi:hypothetical protein